MDDREWMYTGRSSQGSLSDEWIEKTDAFLELAFAKVKGARATWCPCSRCANTRRQTKEVMGKHLCKFGFTADYTRWIYHGESDRMREEVVRPRVEDYDADGGVGDMLNDYHEAHFAEGRREEEPEATAKAYYDMLSAAQKPLHGQTKVSQLDGIGRVMALKSQFSLSRDAFDAMLTVFGSMLPEGHILPKSMYESKKLLRALKMPYEQIHACPKGCILFRKEHAEAKYCAKCGSSRFLEVDSGDGQKRQLAIPVKILRYLPFIPRIQRLYMTEETAKQMTWHKNGRRYNPEKLVHPSDGEAWTHFDVIHREKAVEARNVRVALATDGFNPYGMMAAPYTCWPVFVIPLNLPPGVLFQRQNIFLSLIIPEHPGNNMGVFMEPVIDELVRAWEEGVWTYDRATKRNFKMHVWYHYSLHDFPAYGIFCGWCVHGKFPCPVCKAALKFIWLLKGGKYSSFDKHRQFLPLDHAFRRDIKNFTKGVVVIDPAPQMMTGAAVRAQIDALEVNQEGGFVGYGEQHAWTHKSGLLRLPYFDDLLLPHNIDVMHTEKNVAEALWATIMDIPDKTKDNIKARVDLATLCDRPKQEMKPPRGGRTWRKPKAEFVLTRPQRREVLEWFQTLMFPDGYAANLRRGVNLSTMRINGLKSHDYHIWLERLLPVMVRGYVPEHVWLVLAELSNFFRQLCAKELSRTVIADLERMAPVLLCKLEKIFPPGFFNPMQHLILHLPYEARMGGPVQGRWCYPIERCLKVHRTKCKNKCKIEASVAEAYILEEVSNFTTTYYGDNLPSVHNPPPRYNAGENESNLSIFRGQLGSASDATPKTLKHEEWRTIMLYVLNNLSEVEPYMREFHHQFWRESREPTPQEAETLLRQGAGNGMSDFISWFKQKGQTDASMSAELRQVADGCAYRVSSFTCYDVNGYRFHTTRHEQSRPNRRTTNTGVFTPGLDGVEYYGRIEEIYELTFHGCKPLNPVIFKCHWFDPEVTRRTPNLGLVEIRQSSVLPGDDVYIVAQQATQVYYLSYPCQKDDRLKGWDVVYKVSPHGKLPVPNNEDYNFDPNTYDGEFFQEEGLEGSFEIDLTEAIGMEVDNERVVDEDAGDEVQNVKDLELLQRLHLGNDSDDNIAPSNSVDYMDMADSDDETYDPANPDHSDYF